MRRRRSAAIVWVVLLAIGAVGVAIAVAERPVPPAGADDSSGLLFHEGFDDADLEGRGWYDADTITITDDQPQAGGGAIEFRWDEGGTTPATGKGLRRLFEPTESVYVSCYFRLSPGWRWSRRSYHPHVVYFLTTANGPFDGPARTHLTLYVEPVAGRLRLGTQDIANKDKPHGLTQGRLRGGYNGRNFDSADVLFTDNRWHRVEALFQLNTIDEDTGEARADGVVRGWFDGELVIDRTDVVLRSPDFPDMRINQVLLKPYFGAGLLRQAQTLWVDEMTVGTRRVE